VKPRRCRCRRWPRLAPPLSLCILALAAQPDTRASPSPDIAATTPWGEVFLAGMTTELHLPALNPSRVPGTLEVRSGGYRLIVPIDATNRGAHVVPLRPDADGAVSLLFRDASGQTSSEQVRLAPLSGPIAVDADVDTLPQTAAGYGPVASLRIGAAVLASLPAAQAQALAEYLASCGRLEVHGADAAVLQALRAAAGCGGAFVSAAHRHGAAPAGALPPGTPPQVPIVANTQCPTKPGLSGLLLVGYPLLLLGLLALPGQRPVARTIPRLGPWLLLVPPIAALLFLWLLPPTLAGAHMEFTGLMTAADVEYRWRGRVSATGGGRTMVALRLPARTQLPVPADGGDITLFLQTADGQVRLPLPRGLAQRRDLDLSGNATAPWRLRLERNADDIHIANQGDRATPPAWLFVEDAERPGRIAGTPTPALEPGTGWHFEARLKRASPATDTPPPTPEPQAPPLALLPALVLPLPDLPGGDPRLAQCGSLVVSLAGALE
jgi:hypothetical protein